MAYCASALALLRLRRGQQRHWAAAAEQGKASTVTNSLCTGSTHDAADALKLEKAAAITIKAVAVAGMPPAPPAAAAPSTQLQLAVVVPLQPAVRIFSTLDLTQADVQRMEAELVASRNRFVCLQLATMAREQHAAVQQARSACDSQQLLAAARMHFATLEVGGQLVAGALFYTRDSSHKGDSEGSSSSSSRSSSSLEGAAAAGPIFTAVVPPQSNSDSTSSSGSAHDPHVYVELLVTSQPGRGWGSLLLAAIEQHAAAHASTALVAASGRPPCALKLLSVGSAQPFYRRCGYSEPDQYKEMAKLLAAVVLPVDTAAA